VKLTAHIYLALWLRLRGAISHSPIRVHGVVFNSAQDISSWHTWYLVKHRNKFTFILMFQHHNIALHHLTNISECELSIPLTSKHDSYINIVRRLHLISGIDKRETGVDHKHDERISRPITHLIRRLRQPRMCTEAFGYSAFNPPLTPSLHVNPPDTNPF